MNIHGCYAISSVLLTFHLTSQVLANVPNCGDVHTFLNLFSVTFLSFTEKAGMWTCSATEMHMKCTQTLTGKLFSVDHKCLHDSLCLGR